MKNIFKFLLVAVVAVLALASCEDEANRDWTTPEASFSLYDTSLGDVALYPTMAENPFIMKWDAVSGTSEYTVQLSATEDFAAPFVLGTSNTNTYTSTIGALNTALLQAGFSPYSVNTVYARVMAGAQVSTVISFNVTPYPADVPVITSPAAGTAIALSVDNEADNATTVTWKDYTYTAVDVAYTVKIAAHGGDTYQTLGTVTNATSLPVTVQELNNIVLKTGATPGVESAFDLIVSASTTSAGGTIEKISEPVTVNITPYESTVFLYLIGDATAAGWDNTTDNPDMFPLLNSHTQSTLYTYTGYFKAGGFKLIKNKGSWDNQYGKGSADGTLSTDGGSGNISVPADGYYKLTVDVSKLTYTLQAVNAPTSSYATIGIIGSATPNGWDGSTAMTQSGFDPHVWYLEHITLSNGEAKFRANNEWTVGWGGSDEVFGTGSTDNAPNIPVQAGVYDIYFNDYSGAYTFIAK